MAMLDLKKSALQIFRETLAAIDIPATMRRKLSRKGSYMNAQGAILDLSSFERICAVAIGKASVAMAHGLAELLSPEFNAEGIVVAPTLAKNVPAGFRAIVAGHPVPNAGSFDAGRSILDFLASTNDRTLIFFLLSGGGSALVEQPLDPAVSLADMQMLNRLLVTCGASIDEMNAVRKHLSAVKGGRLTDVSRRWRQAQLCPIPRKYPMHAAWSSATNYWQDCQHRFAHDLNIPKPSPKRPSRAIPNFAIPFFSFCWDAMICFIPRTVPPKPPDSSRCATTRPTIGPSSAPRTIFSRSLLS
jgi:hypothetical protein